MSNSVFSNNWKLKWFTELSVVKASVLTVLFYISPAICFADTELGNSQQKPVIYLGGSVGLIDLSTKFSVEARKISDSAVVSGSILAGADISPRVSLEASATITEKADVTNNSTLVGDLRYRDYAVSALGYFYREAIAIERDGFSVFGRLGVGYKRFDSKLASRDSDRAHLVLGLGSEYGWENGVATRAEISMLDDDANQLNFSLLKRFNLQDAPKKVSTASLETRNRKLWANRLFLSLPTIYFSDNDYRSPISLTEQQRLNEFAQQLIANPRLEIEVQGHSDATASFRDGLILSRRRAITVSRYLQSRGVRGNRLHIRSYASTQPIIITGGVLEEAVGKGGVKLNKISNRRVEFEIYGG